MAEELEVEKSTYKTVEGDELEVSYEIGPPPLPYITNEVRYRMRNVPFFVLQPWESKAYDPSKVKSKIDSRNTSYVPARPKASEGSANTSSSQKPRWNTSPGKSQSEFNSSIGSPRQDLTSPGKRRTTPGKWPTTSGKGQTTSGNRSTTSGKVQTFTPRKTERIEAKPATPRKNSDESEENTKTRKSSLPNYSHIKPRICTCWEKNGTHEVARKTDYTDYNSADSSPASVRAAAKGVEDKSRKKVVSVGRRVDYSHVTSRIDSCRTGSTETPRSKVVKRELGTKEADQVDGKMSSVKPSHSPNGFGQLQGNAKNLSKLKAPSPRRYTGSYSSSTSASNPGGSSKPIFSVGGPKSPSKKLPASYTSPRKLYCDVKAKVDTSDPNPAHQLKRTISDLTIKEGRQINPRFSAGRSETTTGARGNTSKQSPTDRPTFSRIRGERANGIRSPFTKERPSGIKSPFTKEKATSELISKEKVPSIRRGMGNQNSGFKRRDIQPPRTHQVTTSSADIFREEETEDLAAVVDNGSRCQPAITHGFAEDSPVSVAEIDTEPSQTETGICGMEIDNNQVETTVVLKHILALAGKQNNNDEKKTFSKSTSNPGDLVIVEEDEIEEEYYESEDKVKAPSEIPSSYNLPHLIPRLIVTAEDEELVETVVPEARELESSGVELAVSCSPLGSGFSPSSTLLGGFNEEEEEEDSFSTHL